MCSEIIRHIICSFSSVSSTIMVSIVHIYIEICIVYNIIIAFASLRCIGFSMTHARLCVIETTVTPSSVPNNSTIFVSCENTRNGTLPAVVPLRSTIERRSGAFFSWKYRCFEPV